MQQQTHPSTPAKRPATLDTSKTGVAKTAIRPNHDPKLNASSKATSQPKGKTVTDTEKKTESSSAVKAARGTLKQLGEKTIKVLIDHNPKRDGSRAHKRFAMYKDGLLVADYIKKGGAMSAIRYDLAHKYIALV